jgi:phosphatidylinositol 4-kinase
MFDVTLPFDVGSRKPRMSRHPAAAGTRYRLLQCALSLLQGDMLARSLSKNLLRERVYQTCLDYFCCRPQCPNKKRMPELREDALAMIRFWHTMHSDKKYLKQSLVGTDQVINLFFYLFRNSGSNRIWPDLFFFCSRTTTPCRLFRPITN